MARRAVQFSTLGRMEKRESWVSLCGGLVSDWKASVLFSTPSSLGPGGLLLLLLSLHLAELCRAK